MLTRRAMNAVGMAEVRLSDLRSDYILRLLETNEWEFVSYIVGVDQRSLREHYLPYLDNMCSVANRSWLSVNFPTSWIISITANKGGGCIAEELADYLQKIYKAS